MVEGGAEEVPEDIILEVIMTAHEEIKKIVAFQEDMKAKVGKEKRVFESKDVPAEIADAVRAYGHDKLDAAVRCADKQQRDAQESEVRADVLAISAGTSLLSNTRFSLPTFAFISSWKATIFLISS